MMDLDDRVIQSNLFWGAIGALVGWFFPLKISIPIIALLVVFMLYIEED